jgi:glycosyltransferase involved in cell wall biosynthesis
VPRTASAVYNAPDPDFFRERPDGRGSAQRIMERYQIDRPFLLYAGNIRRHKNIPAPGGSLRRGARATGAHPVYRDLRLVIIGDTISQYPGRAAGRDSRAAWSTWCASWASSPSNAALLLRIGRGVRVPLALRRLRLPPLEAMACGTPVVTSNVSSLPEVVGDAAMLVNPENVFDIARGIRDVLLDEPLRAEVDPPRPRTGRPLQLGAASGFWRCGSPARRWWFRWSRSCSGAAG